MKRIQIFKTGVHKDSEGRSKKWELSDLEKIIKCYDPKKHEAPCVIGHPRNDSPAYAWVERLEIDQSPNENGEYGLYMDTKQDDADFVNKLQKGEYKKRSIGLYPDGTLKHVGFVLIPAIKGMDEITEKNFTEINGYNEIYYNEVNMEEIEKLKNELLKKDEEIKSLKELLEKSKSEFSESLSKNETIVKALNNKIEEINKNIRRSEYKNFCEVECVGKVAPVMIESYIELLESKYMDSINFNESGKKSPIDELKDKIRSLPKIIEFGEKFARENINSTPDSAISYKEKIEEIQRQYLKQGKILTTIEAFNLINK